MSCLKTLTKKVLYSAKTNRRQAGPDSNRARKSYRSAQEAGRGEQYIVQGRPQHPKFSTMVADLTQRIFLAMPVISVVTFLPTLLAAPLFRMRLISFLSISSLLFTAYTLIRVPSTGATRKQTVASDPLSPLHQYGPYLNGALSMLIGLNGFVFDYKNIGHGGFWLLCLLPNGESVYLDCEASTLGDLRKLVVFLVSLFARRTMLDVDFDSLEKLKYPYKGA